MRPRIGITTSCANGQQSVDLRYAHAVERAGGLPIIVPAFRRAATAQAFAALLDGLIITGGPGITRGLIGALPPDLPPVDDLRDASDKLIYDALPDRPILGICYGMQFVSAMAGGAIYADVQQQKAVGVHSADRGATEHEIQIAPGSHLRRILQRPRLLTNSHHIQAIAEPGAGLTATAHTADGVIEALESADGRIIGVQFHPERMDGAAQALFAWLVQQSQAV